MDIMTTEETLKQTIDQFWETVPRVWNLIRNHLRTIAVEQFDISVEQFHVLRHIRKGLTTVKDIADARQISCSAVSQAVEALVVKGLITRTQAADDRRYVHLALTPDGENLLNQLFQQNRTWMMEKMASIDAQDLELITAGMVRLKTAFDLPPAKSQDNS
jgi:MarR family transcriptional regulator, 2-MHQ and catechol-resistance regulon repressor